MSFVEKFCNVVVLSLIGYLHISAWFGLLNPESTPFEKLALVNSEVTTVPSGNAGFGIVCIVCLIGLVTFLAWRDKVRRERDERTLRILNTNIKPLD